MTTDDEIRAAAGRLRRVKAGEGLIAVYDAYGDMPGRELDKWALDRAVVADAYLNPWRPIASAPRDGTRVLRYFPSLGLIAGVEIEELMSVGLYEPDNGCRQPTHWTPLPPPPPAPPAQSCTSHGPMRPGRPAAGGRG